MDTEETEMWFEFLNSILALTGPQPKEVINTPQIAQDVVYTHMC